MFVLPFMSFFQPEGQLIDLSIKTYDAEITTALDHVWVITLTLSLT